MSKTSAVTSHRSILLPALLLAPLAAVWFWPESRPAQAQTRTSAVVFAVTGSGSEASMDAVVVVDGKQLRLPYNDEKEDAQKKFGEQYFATGKVYRLIFGGGEAGTVKVEKWSLGCNNIHAQVTTTTSAKLGGRVMALATSSSTLGKRSVSRRPAIESERTALLALMKTIYQQKRTPATLMSQIKVSNLTATDLDGDGIGEVFAQQGGFDGYAWLIFKKVAGRWRQVHQMAGDAC